MEKCDMMEVIGLDEKDVDKAMKDAFGMPVRAPRDLKDGDTFWICWSWWCKIDGKIYGDYPLDDSLPERFPQGEIVYLSTDSS